MYGDWWSIFVNAATKGRENHEGCITCGLVMRGDERLIRRGRRR